MSREKRRGRKEKERRPEVVRRGEKGGLKTWSEDMRGQMERVKERKGWEGKKREDLRAGERRGRRGSDIVQYGVVQVKNL